MTKVVAINGSAKMEKGNTERVLTSFLEVISQPLVSEEEYRRSLVDDYEKVKAQEKD